MSDLPTPTDLASAHALIASLSARLQAARSADFRPPPPEPTTCCGRGCNGCVWEGFFEALGRWRDDAIERLNAPPG